MRHDLTPAEQILWQALRRRQLVGLRFRCQYPLGPFILDFCCVERRLVVELDGAGHEQADQRDYDEVRSQHLQSYGYRILRFWNREVLHDLGGVLERVRVAAAGRERGESG
jgi:very-short-patch-repair endonuclease